MTVTGMLMVMSLTACQSSPDSSIVVNKDMDALIEKAKDGNSESTDMKTLGEQYDTYQTVVENESLGVKVNVDAKVDIPQTSQMSVIRVAQQDISQELLDAIKKELVGDAKLYDGSVLHQRTRSDIEAEIAEIKELMNAVDAENQEISPEDREVYKSEYQMQIDELQEKYEAAPVVSGTILWSPCKMSDVHASGGQTRQLAQSDETGESIEKNQTDRISESTENTEKSQTDGTNPVVYMPKVLVQSYQCTVLSSVSNEEESDGSISPGDKFSLSITLVNTSKTESVKNMAVKMTLPEENFVLCSASDSQYIDTLYAGSTVTVTYHLQTDLSVSQGQYDIGLDYSYADSEATEYTSSGVAKVMVGKSVKMKFDSPQLPAEVEIADVIETSVQAMNLSRSTVYNVRTEIEADGLVPAGTIYIGDIEAGMAASASTQISITGLTQSDYPYGKTSEVVKCYYEDEAGNEYTETGEFQTEIQSAFSEQSEEEEDQPGQWWVIMIIIAIIIEILMVAVLVKYVKKHKGWRKDESMDQYMD